MSLGPFVQAPLRGAVRERIDSWTAPQSFWATITMIRNWGPLDREDREGARKILSSGYSPKEKDQRLAALIRRARAAERDRTKLVVVDEWYRFYILRAVSLRAYCATMRGRDTLPELLSMNCCTNTYGHATNPSQPANENSVARLFRWVVRRVANRRTKVLARVATCALLLGPSVPVHGGWLKPDVDYSHYDSPLWDQIVNHIKAKILARLGAGKISTDRYFIIPFAFQDRDVHPEHSHSFISVIRVIANARPVTLSNKLVLSRPSPKTGFRHGEYMGLSFEAFTISWVPHDWDTNPHLCVFDGFASRIFPSNNQCPITVGKNFLLAQSLRQAMNFKAAVGIWGPYEIRREGFELGVKRKELLDGGTIRYRADDRLYRKDLIAINCIRAMAGLDQLYPNGGLFGTGFMMWGINGTKRVLIEYTNRARYRGLLLEPVDYKKDLYGFVYAPKRNGRFVYNPFRNASAYHD